MVYFLDAYRRVPVMGDITFKTYGRLCEAGAVVHHPAFGEGCIERSDGVGPEERVTVWFTGSGRKRLLLQAALALGMRLEESISQEEQAGTK